jgi:predicted SnoaL-like aldol condensation-catalyzing enzyme
MKCIVSLGLALSALWLAGAAQADEIPISQAKTMCANGDVGPRTAYGETKDEAAAKRLMFDWACMTLVDGKVKEAFEKYVSKNFCDRSHMVTAGLKKCADYAETESAFEHMSKMLVKDGKIEFPTSATVDGEMVTQWGAGADIFRVHDGKITDHWDASPPVSITMTAHGQAFSDHMQKQIDTGVRAGPAFSAAFQQ